MDFEFENKQEQVKTGDISLGTESSMSAQEAAKAQSDYEKMLESLREKKVSFEGVTFTQVKENQQTSRQVYREVNEQLFAFYEKMGIQIEGVNKYNDAELKIMEDAKLALVDAKKRVELTKSILDTLNAKPTSGIFNWIKNTFAGLEKQKQDAKLAYDSAVANLVFCETDVPNSEKRAKQAWETRRENMSGAQWQQEFVTIANKILTSLNTRKTTTSESIKKVQISATNIATKLKEFGVKKVNLEAEKEKYSADLHQLQADLAEITDTNSVKYIELTNKINALKIDQAKNAGELNTVTAQIATAQTQAETSRSQLENTIDQYNTIDLLIKQLELQIPERVKMIDLTIVSMKNADLIEMSSNQNATNNMLDRKSMENIITGGVQSLHTIKKVFVETKIHGEDMREMILKGESVSRNVLDDIDAYKKEHFDEKNTSGISNDSAGNGGFDPNARSSS